MRAAAAGRSSNAPTEIMRIWVNICLQHPMSQLWNVPFSGDIKHKGWRAEGIFFPLFLHLKKPLTQHIKHLGGKTRGQNENKMWVCGQCVCAAASPWKMRLNTAKCLHIWMKNTSVCASLWSKLFGAGGDQRRDQQSLTQVQTTSFLLLHKQNQRNGSESSTRPEKQRWKWTKGNIALRPTVL